MDVILRNVRLGFFNGYEPGSYEGKLSYSAQLIVDPKSANVAALDKAIEQVAREKWKDRAPAVLEVLRKQDRVCFRHGPKMSGDGVVFDGFDGMYYCSASSRAEQRPLMLKRDKTPSVASDGLLYSGCYADVKISLWAQDNQFGKRVNAQLKVVQFRADGDAFSGGTPPSADGMDDLSDVGEELAEVDDLL
jgi:hypothetical protein